MDVSLAPAVRESVPKLELGGHAGDRASAYGAAPGKAFPGVEAPRALPQLLPAVPALVEDNGVKVDRTAARILEDEPGGESRARIRSAREAELREGPLGAVAVAPLDDQVEVPVRPRLPSDEGVHAPPAVHTGANPLGLETVEHLYDVRRSHDRLAPADTVCKGDCPPVMAALPRKADGPHAVGWREVRARCGSAAQTCPARPWPGDCPLYKSPRADTPAGRSRAGPRS